MQRQLIQWSVLLFILALLVPGLAMAQESEVYDAGTYSIQAPSKWILVSGVLGERELAQLPENVREHYNQRNSDVLFMNIDSIETMTPGFKDSLNIVTVNEPIPLSEDLIKELSTVLKQQYSSMFEQFELESIGMTKLRDLDVLKLVGKYQILNYSVKLIQTFIPSKNESLVVTCTFEASKEELVSGLCQNSLETLILK